ncbi:helix-turn-helix domain-containing protein [Pseudonocardia alni]|uniref:helix-turn-helix domain-containing protein n=1 Tax=Pseudonocardia alni TaxID=33907 RepID=UPI00340CD2BB
MIADRVTALRREAGLNQAELGEQMAVLRPGWSRSTVVKLENYNREAVSVGDLLALAQVLDVPPALLVADPRTVAEVPVAQDETVSAWTALLWLSGDVRLDGRPADTSKFRDAWLLVHAGREAARWASLIGPSTCPLDAPEDVRTIYRNRQDTAHRNAIEELVREVRNILRGGGALPAFVDFAGARNRALELGMADAADDLDRFANGLA